MKVRVLKKHTVWRPGRGTLLTILGTAIGALAFYLGWNIDHAPAGLQYLRLWTAVSFVAIATTLYTFAIVSHLDPPDGQLFSPEFRSLAYQRGLERLETRKSTARIRDIMANVVGNPEDGVNDQGGTRRGPQ